MKNPEEMTLDELKEAAERILQRRKYSGYGETRWEKIQKDPKAYFTKRSDYDEKKAERFGWDLTQIPKLNVNG